MSEGSKQESTTTLSLPNDKTQVRRFWILVALVGFNSLALIQHAAQLFTWPSTANVMLSSTQVDTKTVSMTADGKTFYPVKVPLKEFPFDVKLKQNRRFALVTLPSLNLLLLLALVTTYLRRPMHISVRAVMLIAATCTVALFLIGACEIDVSR